MAEIGATKKTTIDMSSPFFLSPSENPGAVLTQCMLEGDNYDHWEKSMMNAFRAKNKEGFIDGTVKKPGDGTIEAAYWKACNSMISSWIVNSIDKSIRSSVSYRATAKEVWDELRERFSVGNAPKIYQLKGEIASLRQQGMSVVAYYTKLKVMWDELASYSRNPTCTCGGCTCSASEELIRERDEEKLIQFLLGLDDTSFGTVLSNILNMDPVPTVTKAYSLITREESHHTVVRGHEE